MTGQLELPIHPTASLTFVGYCHLCGEPVSAVTIDDAARPWLEPDQWLYLAQKEHEAAVHGGGGT